MNINVQKIKKSLEKLISHFCCFFIPCLQLADVVVNATHAMPIRVAWRDAEGSQEIPLGSLHRMVARDPPLGLALLRGLHDWETSRVVRGGGVCTGGG